MEAKPSFRFTRQMRLRRSVDFAKVKQDGQRLVKGCLIANWTQQPGPASEPLRVGMITPKNVGSAVDRARARRLLRESFRLNQRRLKLPLTLVLVARPSISGKALADVERDFLTLMRQARVLAEE